MIEKTLLKLIKTDCGDFIVGWSRVREHQWIRIMTPGGVYIGQIESDGRLRRKGASEMVDPDRFRTIREAGEICMKAFK